MTDEHSTWIVTFPNTHLALKAERVAKGLGIPMKMIPVPRDMSSDCNMGMRVTTEHRERLRDALRSKGVECDFTEMQ
jgi:hypothetical protein